MTTPYLSRREAADRLTKRGLRVTEGTLGKYATVGGGPPFQHFGNRVVYTPEKLDEWAEVKLNTPRRRRKTSAPQPANAGNDAAPQTANA